MERRQVSAGQLVVLLLSLALVALSLSAVSVREMILTQSSPAYRSTVAVVPASMSVRLPEESDSTNSTIWSLEAFGGMILVLGLGEALRRCCR
jgi:hypothetical protein